MIDCRIYDGSRYTARLTSLSNILSVVDIKYMSETISIAEADHFLPKFLRVRGSVIFSSQISIINHEHDLLCMTIISPQAADPQLRNDAACG